jgi:FtsP/CotA-like multicopper oxidase with cupredoxin domain
MNRRRFIVTGISLAATGVALGTDACSPGSTGSVPIAPPVAPAHEITTQHALSNIKGYKLRTRTYNGRTVGPTIETRPGDTLSMRIVNRLPPNPPAKGSPDRLWVLRQRRAVSRDGMSDATQGGDEEWRIENDTADLHPFHLHENSFQLIAINDKPTIRCKFGIPLLFRQKSTASTAA